MAEGFEEGVVCYKIRGDAIASGEISEEIRDEAVVVGEDAGEQKGVEGLSSVALVGLERGDGVVEHVGLAEEEDGEVGGEGEGGGGEEGADGGGGVGGGEGGDGGGENGAIEMRKGSGFC